MPYQVPLIGFLELFSKTSNFVIVFKKAVHLVKTILNCEADIYQTSSPLSFSLVPFRAPVTRQCQGWNSMTLHWRLILKLVQTLNKIWSVRLLSQAYSDLKVLLLYPKLSMIINLPNCNVHVSDGVIELCTRIELCNSIVIELCNRIVMKGNVMVERPWTLYQTDLCSPNRDFSELLCESAINSDALKSCILTHYSIACMEHAFIFSPQLT